MRLQEVAQIKLVNKKEEGKDEEAALGGLAGGSSFDFNPFNGVISRVGLYCEFHSIARRCEKLNAMDVRRK